MSGAKRILVADDDRMVRELLRMVLSDAGYEVSFAYDGLGAVEMATSQQPDLVITDGLLPRLHGFQVCRAIKRLPVPPKVLLLTGIYTKPTYRCEAREYGADAVLSKSSDRAQLLAAIERLIGSTDRQAPGAFDTTSETNRAPIDHVAALVAFN
jgi:two-component system, chemotaxis family, response regulator PixH